MGRVYRLHIFTRVQCYSLIRSIEYLIRIHTQAPPRTGTPAALLAV